MHIKFKLDTKHKTKNGNPKITFYCEDCHQEFNISGFFFNTKFASDDIFSNLKTYIFTINMLLKKKLHSTLFEQLCCCNLSAEQLKQINRTDVMPKSAKPAYQELPAPSIFENQPEITHQPHHECIIDKRDTFAGIGTNKAKRRLNSLAHTSSLCHAYRIALEIEEATQQIKRSQGQYKLDAYHKREALLEELVSICAFNEWNYGIEQNNVHDTTDAICFEFPGCEPISWHIPTKGHMPIYNGKPDGLRASTLDKLEIAIKKILMGYGMLS